MLKYCILAQTIPIGSFLIIRRNEFITVMSFLIAFILYMTVISSQRI